MLSAWVPRPIAEAMAAAVRSPATWVWAAREASSRVKAAVWLVASAVMRISSVAAAKAASSALTT